MNFGSRVSIIFIVLLLCLGFVFQGSRGIWQPDEGYYVGTAVTMLEKGSVAVPFLGEDEIFLDKPPLIYWGIIGGLKVFGSIFSRFFLCGYLCAGGAFVLFDFREEIHGVSCCIDLRDYGGTFFRG